MPHLAIFLPSLGGGGAERVMVTLANAISARGFAVDLVLAEATGPYLADVSPAVRVVDFRAGRVIKALWPLARYLKRERPQALLAAMNHANVVAVLAWRLARLGSGLQTRMAVSEHTNISSASKRSSSSLTGRMVYALVSKLYPWADVRLAVSREAAADLARFIGMPATAVQAIYNPFDLKRLQAAAQEPIDHPWFAPGQPQVVLAVGRLTEAKDFPKLIRSFALLRERLPQVRLLILGEGELRPELGRLLHQCGLGTDAAQMPGFVRNPHAYYARCALFVLSSRWEGLPTVLIEAMICGAPVVATRCPSGPDEILEGGRWGALVPVGDVAALTLAMEQVLRKPRADLPDVRLRALDFDQERAVDAYLAALGLPRLPT